MKGSAQRSASERFAVTAAVVGTLLLTFFSAAALRAAEADVDETRLGADADAFATVLRVELERLADAGVDVGVAVSLVPELDDASYGELLTSLGIEVRFAGVYGISFIERVERDQLGTFLERTRRHDPDFELATDGGEDLLRVVTFSHPVPANEPVIGVDLTTRPDSRRAADRAWERGRPVLSDATEIVQLGAREPGAVIHAPVVRRPGRPDATVGVVFSGQRLIERIRPLPDHVGIRVTDPESLGFSELASIGSYDPGASLRAASEVVAVEQRWLVEMSAAPGFATPLYSRGSLWVTVGGLLASVLVGLFVRSLVARERLANALVGERTRELSSVNDRLERTNAALADASRAKDEFLASVSHELRTPLTVIAGFVESLRRVPASGADLATFLDPIDRNVRRLDTLVSDLLTLVSLDAGAVTAFRRPVELGAVLPDAPSVLAGLDGDVSVRVEPGCSVEVDPRHLDRILVNLLVNAQRHGRPPYVLSAATAEDGMVEIRLRDNGDGIPYEQIDGVFERFARGSASARVPGTGLGLAIIRELSELNGGEVRYEPASPGACFVIRLLPGS